MRKLAFLVSAAAMIVFSAVPATAHHAANAVYDLSQLKVMKGVLTRVEWVNPHARFHFIDADEAAKGGSPAAYTLETGGPAAMRRMGMSGAGMMKIGATYTVSYRPARNGSRLGLMSILEFPDGKKFSQLPSN